MRHLLSAGLVAALVALAACGGSNSNNNNNNHVGPSGQTYSGLLSDGSVVVLEFGAAEAARAMAARPQPLATLSVTGTITVPGSAPVDVSGTYDTDAGTFTVAGGGYSLSGSFADGMLQGDCTTPSGTGIFVAMQSSDGGSVTTYCGTYDITHSDNSEDQGTFSVVVSGSTVYGLVDDGTQLVGTVSGSTVTLSIPGHQGTATGTLSSGSVSGTISAGDGTTGTFTASSAACTAQPPVTCTSPTSLSAPAVSVTYDASTMPAAQGGTVSDGTYYRTAITSYGAASGDDTTVRKAQLIVSGSGTRVDMVQQSDQDPIERTQADVSFSGTSMTLTVTCSDPASTPGAQMTMPYTASGSTLLVVDPQGRLDTFTRQ